MEPEMFEHRQLALKHHERTKRKYTGTKQIDEYWGTGLWKAEKKEFILATHKTPVYRQMSN
jgi:hypothetical protein